MGTTDIHPTRHRTDPKQRATFDMSDILLLSCIRKCTSFADNTSLPPPPPPPYLPYDTRKQLNKIINVLRVAAAACQGLLDT